MQITRPFLTLTRPITPLYSNKSKVNESPPAPSQRSGFDHFQLGWFSRVIQEIVDGNTQGWPPLHEIQEKVQLFIHFLQLDYFHLKSEEERGTAFQAYLSEKGITHMDIKSLQAAWDLYTEQLNRLSDVPSIFSFIKEWTIILERIESFKDLQKPRRKPSHTNIADARIL
jgi:hypothetical protein